MTGSPLASIARLAFGNVASRIYLGIVAATMAFVIVDTLFADHPDASLAGVWMFFATAPTSFFLLLLPVVGETPGAGVAAVVLFATVIVSAVLQAIVIGLVHRAVTRSGRGEGPAAAAS